MLSLQNASQSTPHEAVLAEPRSHVCPWWIAWALANPIRRWFDNPEALIGSLVGAGDRVLEIGPGAGFYTVPLARRVGPQGKVYCIDVQPQMLDMVKRTAARQGIGDRLETRQVRDSDLGVEDLKGAIDSAVLIYVLHEVPDPLRMLIQIHATLRPGGKLLLVEPKGHCSPKLWAAELWAAEQAGFTRQPEPLQAALAQRQAAIFTR